MRKQSERYKAKNEIRFLVSNSASLQTVKLKYTVKLAIKHKSLFEYILKVFCLIILIQFVYLRGNCFNLQYFPIMWL